MNMTTDKQGERLTPRLDTSWSAKNRTAMRWVTWTYFMPIILIVLCLQLRSVRAGWKEYWRIERKRRHEEDVAWGTER